MEFKLKQLETEPTILPEKDEKEIWKSIEDFARYEISSFGRVRRAKDGYILKARINASGYEDLTLRRDDGKLKTKKIHILVATAFCDGYDESTKRVFVDHLDQCSYNNYYKNLRYVTKSENFYNTKVIRQNISRTNAPVVLIDKHTEEPIKFFSSIREASQKLNLNEDNIAYNVHRTRKPFRIGYFVLAENLTK